MADVNAQESSSRRKPTRKTRKRSTRIDMTAMVDVAFLLLTFFVLTTTMNNNHIMNIVKPPKCEGEDCGLPVLDDKILTLILEENDRISYYHGMDTEELKNTDFSEKGVRKVIIDHLRRKENLCDKDEPVKGCWDPIFVIKPKKSSRFANLVDILDEMAITRAPKYALAEFTPQDSLLLASNVSR